MWLKDIIKERLKQYDCITEEQMKELLDKIEK